MTGYGREHSVGCVPHCSHCKKRVFGERWLTGVGTYSPYRPNGAIGCRRKPLNPTTAPRVSAVVALIGLVWPLVQPRLPILLDKFKGKPWLLGGAWLAFRRSITGGFRPADTDTMQIHLGCMAVTPIFPTGNQTPTFELAKATIRCQLTTSSRHHLSWIALGATPPGTAGQIPKRRSANR